MSINRRFLSNETVSAYYFKMCENGLNSQKKIFYFLVKTNKMQNYISSILKSHRNSLRVATGHEKTRTKRFMKRDAEVFEEVFNRPTFFRGGTPIVQFSMK